MTEVKDYLGKSLCVGNIVALVKKSQGSSPQFTASFQTAQIIAVKNKKIEVKAVGEICHGTILRLPEQLIRIQEG